MRTLKKTLALVLVIAMVFSLCAMSVSAVDAYKDDKAIENKLAVYALTEMGVLNGMDGENFAPNGNFTRAQAAKIIAYLLGDGEEAAKKTSTDFADVDKDYWASGYIAYCANLGIVEGYGDGTYGPDDALTGYQWLKMVICALGYNATVEGLNGVGWDVMTAIMAGDLGLIKGVETLNKREIIAREDAAQIAYNALAKTFVEYAAEDFIPGTTVGTRYPIDDNFLNRLGYTVLFGFDRDVYGRPETAQWAVLDLTDDEAEPVVVYEETTKYVEYNDAQEYADVVEALGEKAVISPIGDTADSENGDVLRVYDLNKYVAGYEIHLVEMEVYELGVNDVVPAGLNTKAYVMLDGNKLETEAYAVGDVVVYALDDEDKVAFNKEADVAEGTITNVKDVNGETVFYVNDKLMALHGDAKDLMKNTDLDMAAIIEYYADADEFYFYTDEYGYVVAIDEIPELTEYYGFMTDYEHRTGAGADDLDLIDNIFGGVKTAEKFEIVTPAGETVVYDGAIVYEADRKTVKAFVGEKLGYSEDADNLVYGLVKYWVNRDGKIAKIELIKDSNRKGFKQGVATLGDWDKASNTFTASKTHLITSATVGFIYDVDVLAHDVTAKAYTGYQNIPSVYETDKYIINSTDVNGNKLYKVFSADADELYAEIKTDYVYVASETYTQPAQVKGYVNTYTDVYINGVKSTISFYSDDELKDAIQDDQDWAGAKKLYKVTYDAKGYVADIELVAPVDTDKATVLVIDETWFKTTTTKGTVITYFDADTAFYQIVEDAKGNQSIVKVDALQALKNDIAVVVGYVLNTDLEPNADAVYFFVTADALTVAKSEATKDVNDYAKAVIKALGITDDGRVAKAVEDQLKLIKAATTVEAVKAIADGQTGSAIAAVRDAAQAVKADADAKAKLVAAAKLIDGKTYAAKTADAAKALVVAAVNDSTITVVVNLPDYTIDGDSYQKTFEDVKVDLTTGTVTVSEYVTIVLDSTK